MEKPKADTVAAAAPVARIVEVRGDVRLRSAPAALGAELRDGDEVAAGEGGAALELTDGTRIALEAQTRISRVTDGPEGRRVVLARGTVQVRAARQSADRPLVVDGGLGTATVLGTVFRVVLESASMRLEVAEGKVRLIRSADRRGVDVAAGQFAVAAPGAPPVARPLVPTTQSLEVEEFGTARGVRPADGPAKRTYLEPLPTASGGHCVAAPGAGTEVSGAFLLGGDSTLWIAWRDDDGCAPSFDVILNGALAARVAGEGKTKNWKWTGIPVRGEGRLRVTLRSTFEGVVQRNPAESIRTNPYAVVNRWDRLVLTRDPEFRPDRR